MSAPTVRDEGEVQVLDRQYTGTPETVKEMLRVAYGDNGAKSWRLRKFTEDLVKNIRARDYWSEALAVYYCACGPRFRYTHDPESVELVKSPDKMLMEIETRGVTLGDCDDLATFIIGALSTLGIPSRISTGAFEVNTDLWPHLANERPEAFGFVMRGPGRAGGPFSHVWAEGRRPDGVWVILDPVAGPDVKQMRRKLRQIRHYMNT